MSACRLRTGWRGGGWGAALAAALGLSLACTTARVVAGGASAAGVIQLNQVGFLPQSAKWAAVPVGEADATRAADATFWLVDADSGRVVFQGPLGPVVDWPEAGQRLRLADFSAWQGAGDYRLQVVGQAPSARFRIDPQAYADLNAAALKAFYFNRASQALLPAHAGAWARPAGHPDTVVKVHVSAVSSGRPAGSVISAPKGWYDAGDYNKYIVNSGVTLWTLLAAWEHFPQFFRAQRLNIPESGQSALPDLLQEALWNLDWMLAMQDPADGGVYHKLTNAGFDGVVMPHAAQGERWVVAKSTAATLDFAAVTAMAARVMREFETQRPGMSDRLLAASRSAWAWAKAHPAVHYRQPADIHTGGYEDDTLWDEHAWAAAELFISTGERAFWDAFEQAHPPGRATAMDPPGWADVAMLGWMSLAHHRQALASLSAAERDLPRQRVAAWAAAQEQRWHQSPQKLGVTAQDYGWGSSGALMNRALVLLQGWRLGGPRSQGDAAQALLDHVLGRNALASSWVTGFGERRPLHPHHRPSQADGVPEPVPGFLVGGPNSRREDAAHCPVPYASTLPARAWLDHFCSYASNEVAINWNAPLVYVTAGLQALTPPASNPANAQALP